MEASQIDMNGVFIRSEVEQHMSFISRIVHRVHTERVISHFVTGREEHFHIGIRKFELREIEVEGELALVSGVVFYGEPEIRRSLDVCGADS